MYMAKKLIKNPESFSRRFGVFDIPSQVYYTTTRKDRVLQNKGEAGIQASIVWVEDHGARAA